MPIPIGQKMKPVCFLYIEYCLKLYVFFKITLLFISQVQHIIKAHIPLWVKVTI